MKYTISRPPNDTFSFNLFNELLSTARGEYDSYYLWTNPPEIMSQFFRNVDFNRAPNVIIGIKDMLDMWQEYDYWNHGANAGTLMIDEIAQKNPDTNFIIVTSLENIHCERILSKNIQFVSWGGDCVNQHTRYQTLEPVLDKNFESTKHAISLNRNMRSHRIVYLCYLLGKRLDANVELSCLGIDGVNPDFEPKTFLDRIFWRFEDSDAHRRMRMIAEAGYKRFFNNKELVVDDYEIYGATPANDNISNFNSSLRAKYCNSFMEVVTESSFCAPSYMLTEKTMHAFYGCNFPIILSGAGAVQHLRDMGFDMFDDIIDHGYDTIENPFDRIIYAIDNNESLFKDGVYVKEMWVKHRDRIIGNVEVAKGITDYYRTRAKEQWQKITWK